MVLSIIIVSYNTRELTAKCLRSIFDAVESSQDLQDQVELIIVDNHSTDGSIEMLQECKKSAPLPLTLLANTTNLGFAGANNQAILHAKGDFFWLLNSDARVHKGTISQLLQTLDSKEADDIGILAAQLTSEDGSLQPQGGDIPTLFSLCVFAFLLDDLPLIGRFLPSHQHTGRRAPLSSNDKLQRQGWVAGTAMTVRSNLVPCIGVLDEQIFMYAEDLEYCWRAQKAGWRCAIDTQATVVHLGSKSSSSAKALEGEFVSLKYVLSKHLPWWQVGTGNFLLKMAARNRQLLFSILQQPTKADLYRSIFDRL